MHFLQAFVGVALMLIQRFLQLLHSENHNQGQKRLLSQHNINLQYYLFICSEPFKIPFKCLFTAAKKTLVIMQSEYLLISSWFITQTNPALYRCLSSVYMTAGCVTLLARICSSHLFVSFTTQWWWGVTAKKMTAVLTLLCAAVLFAYS